MVLKLHRLRSKADCKYLYPLLQLQNDSKKDELAKACSPLRCSLILSFQPAVIANNRGAA